MILVLESISNTSLVLNEDNHYISYNHGDDYGIALLTSIVKINHNGPSLIRHEISVLPNYHFIFCL